jgi:hypothetical protein
VKMAVVLPKASYTFNAIPIKIPMTYHRVWKINTKVHSKAQKTKQPRQCWEKKSNTGGITIPNFKLYYRAIAVTAWAWHRNRHEDHLEQKTQIWIHTAIPTWFFIKVPKTYDGENTASSTNVAGKTGYLHAENWNWIHVFHPVQVSTQSGLRILI